MHQNHCESKTNEEVLLIDAKIKTSPLNIWQRAGAIAQEKVLDEELYRKNLVNYLFIVGCLFASMWMWMCVHVCKCMRMVLKR